MARRPGPSVRLKLALSYAGFLVVAGVVLLTALWVFTAQAPDSSYADVLRDLPDLVRGIGALRRRSGFMREFAPAALVVLGFLVVFGLLGGWLLAGRMLAPLDRVTEATRRAADGSLAHRIRLAGRQDELRELADAFDAMLDRLEAHVAEQRRFAANASHELRTPLAISQTLLDVARTEPPEDPGELVERLHAVNARAIDLTEALLVLSRADQGGFAREPVDLSLLAEEAAEVLLPLAETRHVAVEATGEVALACGSPALLLQLTTNLVHNAIVHNRPDGGTVWVGTGVERDGVVLTVENTGEVLAPEVVATLAEPFQRGTGRIRDGHAGVGLGLAIVDSISRVHDGVLSVEARPEGGLRVEVRLPAADVSEDRASRPPAGRGGPSTRTHRSA